jgi:hypothetical protein
LNSKSWEEENQTIVKICGAEIRNVHILLAAINTKLKKKFNKIVSSYELLWTLVYLGLSEAILFGWVPWLQCSRH